MNIKSRVQKLEKKHSEILPTSATNPAVSMWLKTLTNDELEFLINAHTSEEFRTANAAKVKELQERYDEFQKQNKAY